MRTFTASIPATPECVWCCPARRANSAIYYVRVSSTAPLAPGAHQTSGEYQLQIRLQKVYEHPGSTIRYADIRYATNGIEVLGLPGHSPLSTDVYETEAPDNPTSTSNNTFDTAQPIGNLLQSDQNEISVGGYLADYQDVDWYKLDLKYDDTIQRIPDITTEGSVYPVTIDLDYADGLVRPDTKVWVFDETGALILQGTDSGIVDDQPDPTAGTNLDDLTRGSVGARDPFIGPVYLLEGHTYYIAVTSTGAKATALTDDPMSRLEPIDSIQRIAEDNIDGTNASGIGNSPQYDLNLAPVPFHLGDVTMYVLNDGNVFTADPFTGATETTYDPLAGGYSYGDLVMRPDGSLYAITRSGTGTDQNADSGRLQQLSTGDTSVISDVSDGLVTYRYSTDPNDPWYTLEVAGDNEAGGVHMEAMVYSDSLGGWLVTGNALNGFGEVAYQSNLLYLLKPDGTATDPAGIANDYPPDAGVEYLGRMPTNIIPIAQLATGPVITAVDATHATDDTKDILDGTQFTVTNQNGEARTFELDCGPDVDMGSGALDVRDGMTFTVGASDTVNQTFEFDGGPVMVFGPEAMGPAIAAAAATNDTNAANDVLDGTQLTVTDVGGNAVTFELDCGPDIDLGGGAFERPRRHDLHPRRRQRREDLRVRRRPSAGLRTRQREEPSRPDLHHHRSERHPRDVRVQRRRHGDSGQYGGQDRRERFGLDRGNRRGGRHQRPDRRHDRGRAGRFYGRRGPRLAVVRQSDRGPGKRRRAAPGRRKLRPRRRLTHRDRLQ